MDAIEMQRRIQQMTAGGASRQQMADFAEDLVAQSYDDARRNARVASGVMAAVLAALAGGTALAALSAAQGNGGSSAGLGAAPRRLRAGAGAQLPRAAPGASLAGYVDRSDPARIFIDWRARAAG